MCGLSIVYIHTLSAVGRNWYGSEIFEALNKKNISNEVGLRVLSNAMRQHNLFTTELN